MKERFNKFKTKAIDALLIIKIKGVNFVKEHKLVSSFLGLFLVSGVIAVVAFATDDSYSNKINVNSTSVAVKDSLSNDIESNTVDSFSMIVYDVSYKLGFKNENDKPSEGTVTRDKVVIEATYSGDYDLSWVDGDDSAQYIIDNANKKVTANISFVKVDEANTQKLYLRVGNVVDASKIKVNITIKEATDSEDAKAIPTSDITVTSKTVDLVPYVVSGTAYKKENLTNGRYAPFGILLGINKIDLKVANSLKGLYFNPNQELTLEALQSVGTGDRSEIELFTEAGTYGVYNRELNYFDIPNGEKKPYIPSVYYSGNNIELKKSDAGASGTNEETLNPSAILIGEQIVNVTIGEEPYIDQGIKLTTEGTAICNTNTPSKTYGKTCSRTIKNKAGEIVNIATINSVVDDYTITYALIEGDESTTIVRKIHTTAKKSVTINDDVYTLSGKSKVYVIKDETYTDAGVLKGTAAFTGNDEVTLESSLDTKPIDTSNVGDYTVTYKITSVEDEEKTGELTRTISVVEALPIEVVNETLAPVIKANSITVIASDKLPTPIISVNNKDVECTSENNCSVQYYNIAGTEEIEHINSQKAGTYKVVYTYTTINEEGADYTIVVSNKLTVQIKYTFKIKNIKTDGTFYSQNDLAVLGTYFVNAKSEREEGNTENINVYLKANEVENSTPTINYHFSEGTKQYKTTFNKEVVGGIEEISSGNSVAYGEEVILKSEFKYLNDGDENINSLTTIIPINIATSNSENPTGPFKMLEYSSTASEEPYYINQSAKDNISNLSVSYIACEMGETDLTCPVENEVKYNSYAKFIDDSEKNTNLKLAYVIYTATGVKPGTTIDFRLRLSTNIGNYGSVSLSSKSSYTSEHNGTKEITSNATLPITAFKARSRLLINDREQDTIIDASNTSISTFSVYPTTSLPAELVNTNSAGINNLSYINLIVTIPKGMNYVYNDDYLKPVNVVKSATSTTLTYLIKGYKVNDWIEPVKFDTSYDINITSGTELVVSVLTQAASSTGIIDNSSAEARTASRRITYQNNEVISYGQYTPYSAISKNTKFDITTKLYNNSSDVQSNLRLVTLLPYNDVSNEKASFTGTYTLSNLPEGTLCTKTLPANIINSDKLLSGSEIEWVDCETYKDDKYAGVTAIETTGISLVANQLYENTITITPIGNKTDDSYEVSSYLVINNTSVKNIKATKVSVVSKKITGIVWEDFDSNGIINDEEKKVSDVTLNLYKKSEDNEEADELVQTVTSDKEGKYSFTDLSPATYYIVAKYDTGKYGLSPYQVTYDQSITSSFKSKEEIKEVSDTQLWEDFVKKFENSEFIKVLKEAEGNTVDIKSTDTLMTIVVTDDRKEKFTTKFSNNKGVITYTSDSLDTDLLYDTFAVISEIKGYNYDEFEEWQKNQDENNFTLDKDGFEITSIKVDEKTENSHIQGDKITSLKFDLVSGLKSFESSTYNTIQKPVTIISDDLVVTENTKTISNVNLGLALRKTYSVKVSKFISKTIVTNNLGVATIKDYGNVSLAKLDVKDIDNLSIKVVYTLELENTGYYPGYIYSVKDYIPDGMSFNKEYEENVGWILNDNGYLENNTLATTLIQGGEKKYLSLALDIFRKEAGSFINNVAVEDEDLQILTVAGSEEGDTNE